MSRQRLSVDGGQWAVVRVLSQDMDCLKIMIFLCTCPFSDGFRGQLFKKGAVAPVFRDFTPFDKPRRIWYDKTMAVVGGQVST